jgi:hypothetical protein
LIDQRTSLLRFAIFFVISTLLLEHYSALQKEMSSYSAIVKTCLLTVLNNCEDPEDLYYDCLYRPGHHQNNKRVADLEVHLVAEIMLTREDDVRLTRQAIEKLLRGSRGAVFNRFKIAPIVDLIMDHLKILEPYRFVNTAQLNNPGGRGPIKIVEGFLGVENAAAQRLRERIRRYDCLRSIDNLEEPQSPSIRCA